jgi:hypothetical protein
VEDFLSLLCRMFDSLSLHAMVDCPSQAPQALVWLTADRYVGTAEESHNLEHLRCHDVDTHVRSWPPAAPESSCTQTTHTRENPTVALTFTYLVGVLVVGVLAPLLHDARGA